MVDFCSLVKTILKCSKHSMLLISLRKIVGKVSPILVTLTSRSDSDFEHSNVSLKENKPDGVYPNSNDIDYCVRKNEENIRWFSADCNVLAQCIISTVHQLRMLRNVE